MSYRVSRTAEEHVDAIVLDSARTHGIEAAGRYLRLILTAMEAIGRDPGLMGSSPVERVPNVRAYPIRLSRTKVEPPHRVRTPRHLIVYRIAEDGVADILGLVHDRMVLSRAARRLARDP